VIVVGRNKLGILNHTLLTVKELQARAVRHLNVVLMNSKSKDASVSTNSRVLRELLAPVEVLEIPFLGPNPSSLKALKANHKKLKKVLAQIVD
jgi:dethiobiotin synthetase